VVRRIAPRRAGLAGLLALLLVWSAVGASFEAHAGSHAERSFVAAGPLFVDARHPELPLHFEESAEVDVPRCAVCILQAQTVSVEPLRAALAPGLVRFATLLPGRLTAGLSRTLPLLPGRAPPVA
jgi:hypothetical protein